MKKPVNKKDRNLIERWDFNLFYDVAFDNDGFIISRQKHKIILDKGTKM